MQKLLVPKAGLIVRDPVTMQPLPAEGKEVELNSYWLRRLRDGDVIASSPKASELPKKEHSAKKEKSV